MHSNELPLVLAFVAVVGGLFAYLAAFILLNSARPRPPHEYDETDSRSRRDDVPAPPARPARRRRHELRNPSLAESTPY